MTEAQNNTCYESTPPKEEINWAQYLDCTLIIESEDHGNKRSVPPQEDLYSKLIISLLSQSIFS
jgi:hypothetical protein